MVKCAKCWRKETFVAFDGCKECILNALAKPDVIVNNYWHTFTLIRTEALDLRFIMQFSKIL